MRCSPIRLLQAAGLVGFVACMLFSSCFNAPTNAQANKRLEEVTNSDKAQEPRLALVIGNGDYKGNLLQNPVNDARAMAALLKKQGFVVVEKENATLTEMQNAIRAFGEKLEATPGAVALFYFSGHGLQVGGQNWLVPIAHGIHSERDVPDKAVSAQRVLDQMAGGRLNILILDACRDNPFIPEKKSLSKGLAKMDAPSGTLIAYATSPGKTADDNPDEANGLYTQELLKQMQMPGLDLPKVFIQTRVQVKKLSKGQQVPWEEGALETTDFYFVPPLNKPDKVEPDKNKTEPTDVDTQAAVVITSDPPGATVLIDEQVVGVTPFKYTQELGVKKKLDIEVGLTLNGYKTAVKKVSLLRGQSQTLTAIALLKSAPLKPRPHDDNGDNGNLPATKVNPQDDAVMILVPAGDFLMGDDVQSDNPRHTVTLSNYYIYKNLVTVAQFRKYDAANGSKYDWARHKPDWGWKDNHPMVQVTWEEADAYCKWAGGHLPTEAQWEKAARGKEGLKYPWGDMWDISKLWASKSKFGDAGGTTAVGQYGISPYGCTDMAGNLWQWCADWYDANYPISAPRLNPTGPTQGTHRVLRGGSWINYFPDDFCAAYRLRLGPADRLDDAGFRVASAP